MKKQRYRFRLLALLFLALFLVVCAFAVWSLRNYEGRWFSYSANPRLSAQKANVTEGDILDRNGVLLASTVDGKRVFQSSPRLRSSVVHIIGDRNGMVANSVETFHSAWLYGYTSSLQDAIYRLTHPGEERRGNNVTLTIDSALCAAIPEYFSSHPLTSGKNGAAVVLNYLTGETLALVSLPSFDPDSAGSEAVTALDSPYLNRATQANLYPPGSTFKIVTSAAALENLPDSAERTFTCTGALPVSESFTVTDFNRASHGDLTLREAFKRSCNSVYASLALELGDPALRSAAEAFGFNRNFLFRDLVVENSSYPSAGRSPEALAASGYGQSALAVTPMHLCLISAAVANNGIMREPRLLMKAVTSGGVQVLSFSSANVCRTCNPETAEILQSMMKDVVQGGGSGSRAAADSMDIRGKTGTSESYVNDRKVNYGWFTGYNAQEDLPFAVCVLVEDIPDGETGGTTAAVISHDIFVYLRGHPELVK